MCRQAGPGTAWRRPLQSLDDGFDLCFADGREPEELKRVEKEPAICTPCYGGGSQALPGSQAVLTDGIADLLKALRPGLVPRGRSCQ